MFSKAAQWIAKFSDHPRAKFILNLISFLESWIFPIPPDLLLVPMVARNPRQTWSLALQCSIASVLGGIVGYGIGYYFYNSVGIRILTYYGLQEHFYSWKNDFHKWGVWIILLKGFVPIPYKIVTVFSGLVHFNFWAFLGASVVVRSSRFFLLSALCYRYGPYIRSALNQYFGWVLISTGVVLGGGYVLTKCF